MDKLDHDQGGAPADWRDRLIAILSGDGITELPKVPKWKLYLTGYGKVIGWMLVVPLCIIVGIAIFAYPIFSTFKDDATAGTYMRWVVEVALIIGFWIATPRMFRAARQVLQIKWGDRPTAVLKEAKQAPVLFLRSFRFDTISSSLPQWWEHLTSSPLPTAETNLVQMIWRHAPVLAIGRPGESTPPPGAVRFYVRQDRWKETVEAIVPLCPLIVWTTGHTEGLRWEIKHLLERLPPRKLLLWLHFNVARLSAAERAQEWAKFCEAYRDIFPQPLPRDAAKARFVAFQDDWTPVLIPSSGYRPSPWEMIASWPSTYGLEPFLKQRLG
jgi:hypothetical protein